MFKSKSRLKCAPPAPACGLYLKKVSLAVQETPLQFLKTSEIRLAHP